MRYNCISKGVPNTYLLMFSNISWNSIINYYIPKYIIYRKPIKHIKQIIIIIPVDIWSEINCTMYYYAKLVQ